MKKLIYILVCLMFLMLSSITVMALKDDTQVLECCFTSDSKFMKIVLSEKVYGDLTVEIGNKEYQPEIVSDSLPVKTTFLIDNTTSVREELRPVAKQAIVNYVKSMPKNESVRIASFSKTLNSISDDYTRDVSFVEFALEKVNFDQNGSYIYDAIKSAINTLYGDDDAYYRLIVITDAVLSTGSGVSFDYIRNFIERDNIYHIDFIQLCVTKRNQEDPNIKSLADLSTNTFFAMTPDKFDISSLQPKEYSLLKVSMDNSLTVGEYKGVSINKTLKLSSIMFPQANVGVEEKEETNDNTSLIIIIASVAGGLILIGVAVALIIYFKSREKVCIVGVKITKSDSRDKNQTGDFEWVIPKNKKYLVGRVLHPEDESGKIESNDFAICETAEPKYENSIGRNSFSLEYEYSSKRLILHNKNRTAKIYIVEADRRDDLEENADHIISQNTEIEIGAYTTIKVFNIEESVRKKPLK